MRAVFVTPYNLVSLYRYTWNDSGFKSPWLYDNVSQLAVFFVCLSEKKNKKYII